MFPSDPSARAEEWPEEPRRETVDERVIIVCKQTREGRAAGRAAECETVSVRWMNDLAATATVTASASTSAQQQQSQSQSQQHRAPDGGAPVPLPPEGNRGAVVRGAVMHGPETAYWRPGGTYVWRSQSTSEAMRHIEEMGWNERKQELAVQEHARTQRAKANYERKLALHRAGKAPHPGDPPRLHPWLAKPVDENTTLVEVTPSVLWNGGVGHVRAVFDPVQRAWSSVGQKDSRLWDVWSSSVQRGDPRGLVGLMGRVTNEYMQQIEQRRKQSEAELQERREKAP